MFFLSSTDYSSAIGGTETQGCHCPSPPLSSPIYSAEDKIPLYPNQENGSSLHFTVVWVQQQKRNLSYVILEYRLLCPG